MEIIPAIDIRGGRCVRLRQGDYNRETVLDDDPVRVARQWADQGARRLHLVDLDGAKQGRSVNLRTLRAIVRAVDVPCQVGGGIRDMASIQAMFREVGAERVIIGTQALKRPVWFEEMVATFPGRIVLGVDARDGRVATEGWLETSEVTALELVTRYKDQPLAAVVYTNIANDGMMQGVDPQTLDDLERLASAGLPVIASGGITTLRDVQALVERATRTPGIVGAIVGRALYEGTLSLGEAIAATAAERT